ncbi:MAG: hypothetical protein IPM29_00210 [Planctomycetes bacterium]|nr:hypothetical protein [Planctomycetota bacterium]
MQCPTIPAGPAAARLDKACLRGLTVDLLDLLEGRRVLAALPAAARAAQSSPAASIARCAQRGLAIVELLLERADWPAADQVLHEWIGHYECRFREAVGREIVAPALRRHRLTPLRLGVLGFAGDSPQEFTADVTVTWFLERFLRRNGVFQTVVDLGDDPLDLVRTSVNQVVWRIHASLEPVSAHAYLVTRGALRHVTESASEGAVVWIEQGPPDDDRGGWRAAGADEFPAPAVAAIVAPHVDPAAAIPLPPGMLDAAVAGQLGGPGRHDPFRRSVRWIAPRLARALTAVVAERSAAGDPICIRGRDLLDVVRARVAIARPRVATEPVARAGDPHRAAGIEEPVAADAHPARLTCEARRLLEPALAALRELALGGHRGAAARETMRRVRSAFAPWWAAVGCRAADRVGDARWRRLERMLQWIAAEQQARIVQRRPWGSPAEPECSRDVALGVVLDVLMNCWPTQPMLIAWSVENRVGIGSSQLAADRQVLQHGALELAWEPALAKRLKKSWTPALPPRDAQRGAMDD